MQTKAKKHEISHRGISGDPLQIIVQAMHLENDGEEFCLLSDIGISDEFARSTEERTLRVVARTGAPTFIDRLEDTHTDPVISVVLSHPIVSYGMMEGSNGDFRFITIGCTEQTHYIVVRDIVSFTFYVPRPSTTIEEAVFELLTNNLLKGPRIYEKTAAIIGDFFPRIMTAVHDDLTILRTTIRTADKLDLPCRIYFDPENPADSMISVDGYVYKYNLNVYPKSQINRTLRVIEKQEKRDRRAKPRCPEHMNARERQQLAQRLETTTLLVQ